MDPLSVTASVAGIAGACLATATTLNNLRNKYKDAAMTIAAICAETTVIGTTLAKIQGIMLNNPYILTIKPEDPVELQATFDIALTGCLVIYSCLDIEVQKLKKGVSESDGLGWAEKARFLWKEDTMKELLNNLRGYQSSMSLLMQVLQIETTADIRRLVEQKSSTDILERTAARTRSLRAIYPQSKAPQSIFEHENDKNSVFRDNFSVIGSTIFDFDDEVVKSNPYRAALISAMLHKKEASQLRKEIAPLNSTLAYRMCSTDVIGLWGLATRRKFRTKQLRFEVIFEAPVIFLAIFDNVRGPVPGQKIDYIDGSEESCRGTRVTNQHTNRISGVNDRVQKGAMDPRASWLVLLTVLQEQEYTSRRWDIRVSELSPRKFSYPEYSLAVALQAKTHSWDFMPPGITQPFATIAICHLVQLMAFLGIYWRAFNPNGWNMRAEGNGLLLTSINVENKEVMVHFHITGSSRFSRNRVIPTQNIRDFAFGLVETIFAEYSLISSAMTLGTLQDAMNTLKSLGCQHGMLSKWERNHTHIFSLSFELIGMLGIVPRIRGSSFRMLPNPTHDRWTIASNTPIIPLRHELKKLMVSFQQRRSEVMTSGDTAPQQPAFMIPQQNVQTAIGDLDRDNLERDDQEAIHGLIDEHTGYILSFPQKDILSVIVAHLTEVIEALDNPDCVLNTAYYEGFAEAFMSYYFEKILPKVIMSAISHDKTCLNIQKLQDQRRKIWTSLIFRMLCWFYLHDFDYQDICIVPLDLMGSRMPVYIT